MSDARPLVSVICRTKDRPDFLFEAASSVAAQTWPAREFVCVNDGGRAVGEVLAPLADSLRIRYIDTEGVGRCRAGNIALEHSEGSVITYLDDDDLYLPEHLSTLVEALARGTHSFVYADAWEVHQERGEDGRWHEAERRGGWSQDFSRAQLLRENYIHLVCVAHTREVYERLGGFDETLEVLEDHDLWFRYAQDYDFLHLPVRTAIYRIRNDRSNAVTALRKEFVETRSLLMQRYAHVALPELLGLVQRGEEMLGSLSAQVEELRERVRRLEEGRG